MRIGVALGVGVIVSQLGTGAQEREPLLAFRFDSQRVIATLKSDLNVSLPQLARDSPRRLAEFGYPVFDLPADLQSRIPPWIRPGDRWAIHTAAGEVFGATVERIVLGEAQCSRMLAAVMKIDDVQAWAFGGVRSKYYVAEPAASSAQESSTLGELPATTITPAMRRLLDSSLAAVLAQELPRVRAEADERLAKAASEGDRDRRAWARGLLEGQDALERGAARLTYDAQAYRLTPDDAPLVFVRAFWRAGEQQVFAASAWIRGDTGAILWRNLRPAAWLRMYEFHRGLAPAHLGQVLNVVDRDGDGWAEVIFAQTGYEGADVSLLEARSGFEPSRIRYYYGC